MDKQDYLELLLLQSAELTAKTPFCPGSQQIAEYFDGNLWLAERTTLEHHLPDYRFCVARIGILERLEQNHDDKQIPGSPLFASINKSREQVSGLRLPRKWL